MYLRYYVDVDVYVDVVTMYHNNSLAILAQSSIERKISQTIYKPTERPSENP